MKAIADVYEQYTRLTGGDIVKCCGWRVAHPDGLSGGLSVSVLEFDTLYGEFNEFVTV